MKALLSYYGGKQKLAPWIISHFPADYEKLCYVEPYAGGISVLFFKKPSKREIANDIDLKIFRFYKTFQNNFDELEKLFSCYLYHEEDYKIAKKVILGEIKAKNEVEFAYYYFLYISCAFGGDGGSGFSYTRNIFTGSERAKSIQKRIRNFHDYFKRLKNVTFFNTTAIKTIDRTDSSYALFYIDPPYPDSQQGHYEGLSSTEDFLKLLERLKTIKGKFLLSCYLRDYMKIPKPWRIIKKTVKAEYQVNRQPVRKERTESLIMNFSNESQQNVLFE